MGVGCDSLCQGIFLIQQLDLLLHPLHWWVSSLLIEPSGKFYILTNLEFIVVFIFSLLVFALFLLIALLLRKLGSICLVKPQVQPNFIKTLVLQICSKQNSLLIKYNNYTSCYKYKHIPSIVISR